MAEYASERRAEAAIALDEAVKAEAETERLDPKAEAAKTELTMSTAGII